MSKQNMVNLLKDTSKTIERIESLYKGNKINERFAMFNINQTIGLMKIELDKNHEKYRNDTIDSKKTTLDKELSIYFEFISSIDRIRKQSVEQKNTSYSNALSIISGAIEINKKQLENASQ